MPRVRLSFSDNTTSEAAGGCFGFCGRSNLSGFSHDTAWLNRSPENTITKFTYKVGELFGTGNIGLKDPKPFLNWLATDSPWSKYVLELRNATIGDCRNAEVDIRTDIPGHCVIGTASAFRLAGKHSHSILSYFNLAVQMGSDPAIAMLVYYAMYQATMPDYSVNTTIVKSNRHGKLITNPSSKLSLGDDEVMFLSSITPANIYSFIDGTFEMIRDDSERERLFSQTGTYQQNILASFRYNNRGERVINFGKWLNQRFPNTLTALDEYTVDDGDSMGGSSRVLGTTPGHTLLPTLGWVSTLTNEFGLHGRFLGLLP